MSVRRVLLAFLGLALALAPILALRVSQEIELLRVADAYRDATLVVERAECTGGEATPVLDRHRRTTGMRYERTVCLLHGHVGEAPERLRVGPDAIDRHPSGTAVPVYYAPDLEPFGVDGQNLRLQTRGSEHPGEVARRQLWSWPLGFLAIGLWIGLLEAAYAFAPHVARARAGPGGWVAPAEGAAPAFGFAFAAFGLFVAQGDLRGDVQGLWIVGLALIAIGLPFFVRPLVIVDARSGSARRCLAVGPLQWRRPARALGTAPRVEIVGPGSDEAVPGLVVRSESGTLELMRSDDAPQLRRLASELAERLGGTVRDRLAESERRAAERAGPTPLARPRPSVLPAVLQAGALLALPVLLLAAVPSLHRPVLLAALSRDVPQVPLLQAAAARALSGSAHPEALLALVLTANTTGGEVRAAALRALEATSGLAPAPDLAARLRGVNLWVAERLDRATDANGGVLGWYPVAEIWQDEIESIASEDPMRAWAAWSGFGPIDFPDPAAFLRAVGPALGDPRPISFAIKRGSFGLGPGPDAPAFEGQPEPLAAHRREVLVSTVGMALALRYWTYPAVRGDGFPEDFDAWWAEHAREHLLPPP